MNGILDLVSNRNPRLNELRYDGNHRYWEKSSTEVSLLHPRGCENLCSFILGRPLRLVLEKLL